MESNIYLSLTTIPSRIYKIEKVIKSLSITGYKTIINIPFFCKKENKIYDIPEWLNNYPNLIINRCIDYGPFTKLIFHSLSLLSLSLLSLSLLQYISTKYEPLKHPLEHANPTTIPTPLLFMNMIGVIKQIIPQIKKTFFQNCFIIYILINH